MAKLTIQVTVPYSRAQWLQAHKDDKAEVLAESVVVYENYKVLKVEED